MTRARESPLDWSLAVLDAEALYRASLLEASDEHRENLRGAPSSSVQPDHGVAAPHDCASLTNRRSL